MDNVPVGIALLKLEEGDFRFSYINPAHLRIYGYRDAAELEGESWSLLYAEDFADEFRRSHLTEFIARGQWSGRIVGKRPDGSALPHAVHLCMLTPDVALCVAQDDTPRMAAENALRRKTDTLRVLLDSLPLAALSLNSEGRVTAWNPAAEAMFGWSRNEVLGTPYPLLPKDASVSACSIPELSDAPTPDSGQELVRQDKTGALLPVKAWATALIGSEDEPLSRIIVFQDLRIQKREEEALREREHLFRGVFDHAGLGIAVATPEGRLDTVNNALCEMLSTPESDVVGRSIGDLVYGDDQAAEWDRFRALVGRSSTHYRSTIRLQRPDGSAVPVETVVSALLNEEGDVYKIVALTQDITERIAMETQLRQAHKMEAVGKLAAGIAHDFNNALTAVIGYCELMLQNSAARSLVGNEIMEVSRAAEHAANLTRQLLAFSRQQIVQPAVVDVGRIINHTAGMLRRLIGEDVELAVETASTVPVLADVAQLQQVLINLVVNARDAVSDHGRMRIATTNALHRGAAGVLLEVSDDGSGIQDHVLPHIFEPFFTTKPTGAGSGLGLSTVYGIVQQMGGNIEVRSRLGEGTAFRIWLPACPPVDDPPELDEHSPDVGFPAHLRIVLVEDEPALRNLVRLVLTRAGHTVYSAADPFDATKMMAGPEPCDLLITDVVMPGMSGGELAETVRRLRPALPILLMSGYTADEPIKRGVSEGSIAFLAKPFTPRELLSKVAEMYSSP